MRNMSFALTTSQMADGSKDVTRRLGWLFLKEGDWVRPVRKCMGLKPGEAIEQIAAPVLTLLLRREPLQLLIDNPLYGQRECGREGFPDLTPAQFVDFFCSTHAKCTPATVVTRIEFNHGPLPGWKPMATAPKDGTAIRLLLRHLNWRYAEGEAKAMWEEDVEANWLDFNGGGWTWSGMCGQPVAWRP